MPGLKFAISTRECPVYLHTFLLDDPVKLLEKLFLLLTFNEKHEVETVIRIA